MKRLFLIHGPNEVLRRQYEQEYLEKHPALEKTLIYTPEKESAEFLTDASSDFIFGGEEIFILKDWDKLKEHARNEWEKALLSLLASNTPHLFLLSVEQIGKKFLSSIEPYAEIRECKTLYGRDIIAFIRQQFQNHHIKAEEEVYEYLLDISNQSLEEIDRMLHILIPAAQQEGMVRLRFCQDLLAPATNHSIFDLIRGIFTHNPRLTLQAFRSLRLNGEPLQYFFVMIYRTCRLLWSYKTKGNTPLETWAKEVSISLFEAKRLKEYDQKTSLKQVSLWFERIAYLEELSKSAPEEVAENLFEAFLMEE